MNPRIETIPEKKLVGKRLTMSLINNRTVELWKLFMPVRNQIIHPKSTDLISLQCYPPTYFENFSPAAEFEKWAAVEVSDMARIPEGMEAFSIPKGLYAVFNYVGLSSDPRIFQYIFGTWLPGSEYLLDNRPHFEILGERYKNNHPDSEEEIWIPIRLKNQSLTEEK